jgi:endonuclease/exonuclease/phosphatase family metal-dependent hydrolase
MQMLRWILFVFAVVLSSAAMAQETLTIASWNIANLGSGPDVELRGHTRTAEQYQQISDAIASLDADIVALQEIGSMPGARAVLGSDYEIWFETRCLNNAAKCEADVDDIFTAIAVRKELAQNVEVFQFDELAIMHNDECGISRPVRGAVGVKVRLDGKTYWIPSIHLKSSCNKGTTNQEDVKDDCATLSKQIDILKAWIKSRPAGDAVVLAGDFNRRFLEVPEPRLEAISPGPKFLPAMSERQCWGNYRFDFNQLRDEARANLPGVFENGLRPNIYTPKQFGPIDYFVVVNEGEEIALTSEMIELDDLNSFGNPNSYLHDCSGKPKPFGNEVLTFGEADPSDHCPIRLVIEGTEPLSINQPE